MLLFVRLDASIQVSGIFFFFFLKMYTLILCPLILPSVLL